MLFVKTIILNFLNDKQKKRKKNFLSYTEIFNNNSLIGTANESQDRPYIYRKPQFHLEREFD